MTPEKKNQTSRQQLLDLLELPANQSMKHAAGIVRNGTLRPAWARGAIVLLDDEDDAAVPMLKGLTARWAPTYRNGEVVPGALRTLGPNRIVVSERYHVRPRWVHIAKSRCMAEARPDSAIRSPKDTSSGHHGSHA